MSDLGYSSNDEVSPGPSLAQPIVETGIKTPRDPAPEHVEVSEVPSSKRTKVVATTGGASGDRTVRDGDDKSVLLMALPTRNKGEWKEPGTKHYLCAISYGSIPERELFRALQEWATVYFSGKAVPLHEYLTHPVTFQHRPKKDDSSREEDYRAYPFGGNAYMHCGLSTFGKRGSGFGPYAGITPESKAYGKDAGLKTTGSVTIHPLDPAAGAALRAWARSTFLNACVFRADGEAGKTLLNTNATISKFQRFMAAYIGKLASDNDPHLEECSMLKKPFRACFDCFNKCRPNGQDVDGVQFDETTSSFVFGDVVRTPCARDPYQHPNNDTILDDIRRNSAGLSTDLSIGSEVRVFTNNEDYARHRAIPKDAPWAASATECMDANRRFGGNEIYYAAKPVFIPYCRFVKGVNGETITFVGADRLPLELADAIPARTGFWTALLGAALRVGGIKKGKYDKMQPEAALAVSLYDLFYMLPYGLADVRARAKAALAPPEEATDYEAPAPFGLIEA